MHVEMQKEFERYCKKDIVTQMKLEHVLDQKFKKKKKCMKKITFD